MAGGRKRRKRFAKEWLRQLGPAPGDVYALASRSDRRQQLLGRVRDKQDERLRRGFLQDLEKGVRRGVVHPVGT